MSIIWRRVDTHKNKVRYNCIEKKGDIRASRLYSYVHCNPKTSIKERSVSLSSDCSYCQTSATILVSVQNVEGYLAISRFPPDEGTSKIDD
ncbi:hypothetical protein TNCV_2481741 [Trichonephila clavipes]|nr:hypothetical protein TNCV_2481741 [Trichonephila clavipes]